MEAARYLCSGGTAAGFFPQTYIADDLAAGRLVAIPVRDLARLTRTTALVRKPRPTPPSQASLAMLEALRRQAASLGILVRGSRDGDGSACIKGVDTTPKP